jgi:hypothetical protein
MKKSVIFLVISLCFLCSCTSYIKVTRTVTKTINFNYNINQTGNFTGSSSIGGTTFAQLFADADTKFFSAKIEKVDVQSVSIGANLAAGNTAQQVQVGATIESFEGKKTLLNDTKVIQLQTNVATDILSGIGNVTGLNDKNITLHNAIDLLNATGAIDLQNALKKNLSELNGVVYINLNGKVPPNQKMVMSLSIQVTASVTYSSCEDTGIPFLGDSSCHL